MTLKADFTPEQQQRWDTWVTVSNRRGVSAERTANYVMAAISLGLLVLVAVTLWRL